VKDLLASDFFLKDVVLQFPMTGSKHPQLKGFSE
jgi:hypothetical protein